MGYIDGRTVQETAEVAWTGFLSNHGHAMSLITNMFSIIGFGVFKDSGGTDDYVVIQLYMHKRRTK